MKITYDPFADALYIQFNKLAVANTQEINNDFLVDFAEKNIPVGFEILSVSKKIPKKSLKSVSLEFNLREPKLLQK